MKLKISELNSEFQDRYFDISTGDLPDRGSLFRDGIIQCRLTAKTVQNGFEISGELYTTPEYECARCLDLYSVSHTLPIQLILCTEKRFTTVKDGADTVYYSENQEYLELSNTFADIIELAKPINPVCTKQCKGLCPVCGINKNNVSCSCKIKENETAWNALKQIKPKKS
tara:strand:+ start:168 stop:677 length:510 start_codon:yes stop_codon:yes gene_type:complete